MKPLDLVDTSLGPGVVYQVNEDLKQASVALPSLKGAMTSVGLAFIRSLDGPHSEELLRLRDKIAALRSRLLLTDRASQGGGCGEDEVSGGVDEGAGGATSA